MPGPEMYMVMDGGAFLGVQRSDAERLKPLIHIVSSRSADSPQAVVCASQPGQTNESLRGTCKTSLGSSLRHLRLFSSTFPLRGGPMTPLGLD